MVGYSLTEPWWVGLAADSLVAKRPRAKMMHAIATEQCKIK